MGEHWVAVCNDLMVTAGTQNERSDGICSKLGRRNADL
jgi:hypothetical protein